MCDAWTLLFCAPSIWKSWIRPCFFIFAFPLMNLWYTGIFSPLWKCCLFLYFVSMDQTNMRAIYTGIKKPEFFWHSGFLLEVARQLPLNTAKNQNRKTHLWSVVFWNSAGFSLFFCQCKRSLPSRRYYLGFWSHGMWPSDRGSPAARDVLRTPYGER